MHACMLITTIINGYSNLKEEIYRVKFPLIFLNLVHYVLFSYMYLILHLKLLSFKLVMFRSTSIFTEIILFSLIKFKDFN